MAPALSDTESRAADATRRVQATIARAMMPAMQRHALGDFVLRDGQAEVVAQLRDALRDYGGALVADAPGSGKTVLALAVAAEYDDALVLAPAAIRTQWEQAAARAGLQIRFASLESLSRGRQPAMAALVIVDEAHQLRSANTQRYRTVAALARRGRLLLLSATPVVNRARDREALLALFLGSRHNNDSDVLARVLIRRVARTAATTTVRRLAALECGADVPGLGAKIAALPPPFPAADGASATALVRFALAFAWASSLAALDAALRRRLQRGAVLVERLEAGLWPSRQQLSAWVHGDDATQLALPLDALTVAGAPPSDALQQMRRHLAAIAELRGMVSASVASDTNARANALRQLLRRESPRRVLLLAHHAATVRALYAELRQEPGVVAIVGARVYAAAGRWTRDEVLSRLGHAAPPWSPADPRGIRLLLATDILAEGVELQGCATLVHGDRAWTPARLEQRLGRVAREGQRDEVHLSRFRIPRDAELLLRLNQRIADKRKARHTALVPAATQTALTRALRAWLPIETLTGIAPAGIAPAAVAATESSCCGFLALLGDATGAAPRLVGGIHRDGRWRIVCDAKSLLRLVRAVGAPTVVHATCVDRARRLLQRWLRRGAARALVVDASPLPSAAMRSAMRRLDQWLGSRPMRERASAAAAVHALRGKLVGLRGVAAEAAVAAALRHEIPDDVLQALQRIVAERRLGSAVPQSEAREARLSLCALLILRRSPAAPAPPSACSGSAATR